MKTTAAFIGGSLIGAAIVAAVSIVVVRSQLVDVNREISTLKHSQVSPPAERIIEKTTVVREIPASSIQGPMGAATASAPGQGRNEIVPPPPPKTHGDFEADFASERADGAWSAQKNAEVNRALHALAQVNGEFQPVECRATQCRLEASFDSVESNNRAFDQLFLGNEALVPHGGVVAPLTETDTQGRTHTIFFIAREESRAGQ